MTATSPTLRRLRTTWTAALAAVLVPAAVALPTVPSAAVPSPGSAVVIDEVYGGGGNSGAVYDRDFIELYNPGDEPVALDGWSVQYGSATGTTWSGQTDLTGEVPAGGSFLVAQAYGSNTDLPDLPAPDVEGTIAMSGTGAKVALVSSTERLSCLGAACADVADLVDLVGWGSANTYLGGAPARATTNSTSVSRVEHVNTVDNAADFTIGTPTPAGSGADPEPEPTPTPTDEPEPQTVTIAEIQGTGSASPLVGETVTTRGVVTAAYPTGGFDGLYLQTEGSGGDPAEDATPGASDAVFVYSADAAGQVAVGDHLEVTGVVGEYFDLTQVTPTSWTVLDEPAAAVKPTATTWPATEAEREALESMLLAPQGDYTVTDNYSTNLYGTVGLAAGDTPLVQPTSVGRPGSDEATAQAADNAARAVQLDDGATWNYSGSARSATPLPWLNDADPVRVGATVTFTGPVILDYRYSAWSFQPLEQLTGENADLVQPATFADTREASPQDVGGDLTVGTFNVLNYFTTTGDQVDGCQYYTDRAGNPISVRTGCLARGAADAENLERQEAKIVAAIGELGADVVALEEVENSAAFGKDRDQALADLVDALNAAEGAGTWAYAPSPAEVPADEDVIRNAFIYRPDAAETVGESRILLGSEAFGNAREPLAQVFQPAGGAATDAGDDVLVVTNHFKSKGSAGPWPGDADAGDGQGASNESRVRQATALVDFADEVAADAGTDRVLLAGDFNAYEQEDPIKVLTDAGYTDLGPTTGKYSYSFGGQVGSLDHVLASPAALDAVTGTDIWNINAYEPVANEYSRYNYNATILYDTTPFRSSDHDPLLVGLDLGADGPTEPTDPAWERGVVYTAGDRVSHDGQVFEALWWTRGETPGSSPWGAWAEVGQPVETDAGTYPAWTSSQVYVGGETVVHDGERWQARWWTRNQEPGLAHGPWQRQG
ncbi:ExeM/NucH family extracellular endonuclease [Isoptericola croceus]|uniref:ExeM/NucH family extracellular endonuclease n=1 Tax=Isoptericola croceus TaxID=3031406 RepID=UPI0023F6A370|nr:ExeM/NucH family extracellular endonuclease [Isoptericola croceus]